MKKLPKTLYVKWDDPANGEPCLLADEAFHVFAEVNQDIEIGVYQLVAKKKVTSRAELRGA